MGIVGFNFTDVKAKKSANPSGKVSINNNVMINDVKEITINMGSQPSKGLHIKFNYTCEYQPNVGKIQLDGDVVLMEDEKVVKEQVESWNKDKKIDAEINKRVLSHVLNKSTIQAIILSKEIGLPAPIPMPKIGGKEQGEQQQAGKQATEQKKSNK